MRSIFLFVFGFVLITGTSWSQPDLTETLFESRFQNGSLDGITATGAAVDIIRDDDGQDVLQLSAFDPESSISTIVVPLPKPANNQGYYRIRFRVKTSVTPLNIFLALFNEDNQDLLHSVSGLLSAESSTLTDIHANSWQQFDIISQPDDDIIDARELHIRFNQTDNTTPSIEDRIYVDDINISNGNAIYAGSFETRTDIRRFRTNDYSSFDVFYEGSPFGIGYTRVSAVMEEDVAQPVRIRTSRSPMFVEGPETYRLDYTVRSTIAPLTVYGGVSNDSLEAPGPFNRNFLEEATITEANVWQTVSFTVTASEINHHRVEYALELERLEGLIFDVDHLVVSVLPLQLRSNVQEWALYK